LGCCAEARGELKQKPDMERTVRIVEAKPPLEQADKVRHMFNKE
jgi:hypothetical protein